MNPRNNAEIIKEYEEQKNNYTIKAYAEKIGMTEPSFRSMLFRERRKIEMLDPEELSMYEDEEGLYAESESSRIKTLDELLSACQVDLEKWKVLNYKVNAWEAAAKNANGELTTKTLYQVKAFLVEACKQITPVTIHIDKREFVGSNLPYGRSFIISDPHFGFKRDIRTGELEPIHDEQALDCVLSVLSKNQLDEIVMAGDSLDLSEWSNKFVRRPEFYWTTQPAIEALAKWLGQVRALQPQAKITILQGNHDIRIETLVNDRMNQLSGMVDKNGKGVLSLESLIDLEGLGIDYITGYPNNSHWIGDINIEHGNRTNVVNIRNIYPYSKIFGHLHTMEMVKKNAPTSQGVQVFTYASPGCLCRLDYIVPGHNVGQNWQQGFCVVSDGFIQLYEIQEGRCCFEGKVY